MRLASSKYPAWRDKKESLLDDVQLCGELLKTSEETYLQLGPMAKELRRIADQIEAVNTDKRQPLFAPSLNLKAVRKCADQVVETVTVIFVLSFCRSSKTKCVRCGIRCCGQMRPSWSSPERPRK